MIFFVYRSVFCKIFMTIRLVVLTWSC